jgi:ribosomal protein L7Ae-like RNA K-turn-binding protein
MCAACRQREDREDLVRLAWSPSGELVIDLPARLPGRGAWVHARQACVERLATRPGGLDKVVGQPAPTSELPQKLRAAVERACLDGLSMAQASGALVGGRDELERALKAGRVVAVAVATDAAPRTVAGLRRAAGDGVAFVRVPLGRDDLGVRIGRGSRAAVGVTASRAAAHLLRQLRRLEFLG